jgi:hypothetical protein
VTIGGRLRAAAAVLLGALSLLPLADLIPGGEGAAFYWPLLDEWWNGTLIAVGVGVILGLLSRKSPALWREGAWSRRLVALAPDAPGRLALTALAAGALYAVVSQLIHSARPLLIDEVVQLWQGRLLVAGKLWVPSTGHPELFGVQNVVDHAGKVFGQFPPGGPALLGLGALLGSAWLVGPCFAALGVWWWGRTLRHTEEDPAVRSLALLVLAFAPFALFMSGSYMNHVTALAWSLGGMAGLATVVTSDRPRPWAALGLGLAFGIAATIRPVDAFAFGAPAGLWLLVRAVRDRGRALECLIAGSAMVAPIFLLFAVNAATTGDPFRFGYTLLWGEEHGLGFHTSPWGVDHTPARGLELLNIYLLHLQARFLETPFPSLLPALAVLGFGPRLKPFDRYLAVSGALVLGFYWAYWHNGFYLGPRFVYPLLPFAALLVARFGPWFRGVVGPGSLPARIWAYTALTGGVLAVTLGVPLRALVYGNAFLSSRFDATAAAEAAGARNALVLVRESWGAQVMERMWGRRVPRGMAEFIYHRADICAMDETLTRLELRGDTGAAATAPLLALTADSLRLVDSVLSTDLTERLLPGAPYSPRCVARVLEDRTGFTVFPPLINEVESGNVYVHDQHAGDTVALALYPDRPLFALAPADTTLGAPIRFYPVRRDSLLAAWGLPPDWRPAATAPALSE